MPTSTLRQRYTINGVIDTERDAMTNLMDLARSTGTFVTYDVGQGKWGVVINGVASSVASFGDQNIVGPINVTTTSVFDYYNGIEVSFPLLDTADKTDYVVINTSNAERSIYETDNRLGITLNYCTEPVQAYILGNIELNQSRQDKVVTFNTDWSYLDLKAGDVIDITNDLYQFSSKTFRIVTLREVDAEDGSLGCEITATEYDAAIYNNTTIPRSIRTDRTGIATIGRIGIPATPTFSTDIGNNSISTLSITTDVPTGVVDGVECWISTDGGTNYNLADTYRQVEPLTTGNAVVFQFNTVSGGSNLNVKTRGVNYRASGPFSTVASTVYTPTIDTGATESALRPLGPFSNGMFDFLLDLGNSLTYPVVFQYNQVMCAVIDTIPTATGNMLANIVNNKFMTPQRVAIDFTSSGLSVAPFYDANAGVNHSVWVSSAPYDETEFLANGLSGLTWTDWEAVGLMYDVSKDITGNSFITVNGVSAFDFTLFAGNTTIVSIGFSGTTTPDTGFNSYANTAAVSPVTGETKFPRGPTLGWSGNTCLFEQVDGTISAGAGVYSFPGIAGNITKVTATPEWNARLQWKSGTAGTITS